MSTNARPWHALYDERLPPEIEPEHRSGLAMFEAALARAPDADLVRYFETPLTFGRADELSSALAAGLAGLGVGRGDRIALYLQNGPQFVIALLAAWKLGAIGVSCNPMLRERELAEELRDSGSTVLVTLESLHADVAAAVVGATDVRVVITTSELDLLDGEPPPVLRGSARRRPAGTYDLLELAAAYAGRRPDAAPPAPSDVAILTYTSGTTGPAKGAMNTHANLGFTSQVYRDWMHVGDQDVILGIAPLFHVTGLVAHIGLALSAGVPIVLAHRFDAAETCRLIERHRATTTVAAITAFLALLDCPESECRDLSSLQKAYSGGAPIPPAVVEAFERRTGIVIRSAYGLTETTSPTHLTPLGRRAPVDPDSGAFSAGIPVFNTDVRILDEAGAALGPGEVGEVAVSGPQVVPGYWNRPEESAHAIRDGELLTGDVGKMDADGWLYLVDRRKDLIIASGYKIWPREVEDVLYQHPAVREAAVVGAPDAYRGETVRAFVSLKAGANARGDELVAFCRERLAAYKYPREVDILAELPKTASGKILRRELRTAVAGSRSSR